MTESETRPSPGTLSNQRTTNTWDGESRLTKVALPSGIRNTFSYNGDGQRVQKEGSTGTTKHVWDGQNIILETNASNIIQVVYTLEPVVYGNLISQIRGGVASLYLFDAHGSSRQLTNSMGVISDTYLYDSFGTILVGTGSTTNQFKFVGLLGYYSDSETGTDSIRARHYYSNSGQFLSRDPVTKSLLPSGTKQGSFSVPGIVSIAGPYLYVSNRPTRYTDPSGRDAIGGTGKYAGCCNVPTLYASVANVHMFRGSENDCLDFAQANDIWNQCCIKVIEVESRRINEAQSRAIMGKNDRLDEYPNDGPPTAEELAMTRLVKYKPGYIYSYRVYGLSGQNSYGESFPPKYPYTSVWFASPPALLSLWPPTQYHRPFPTNSVMSWG